MEYLDQYPPVAHQYVTDKKKDTIDNNYGPIFDMSFSKWILGRKNIDFEPKTTCYSGWESISWYTWIL